MLTFVVVWLSFQKALVTVTFNMLNLLSIERILVRVYSARKNSRLMPLLIKR